MSSGWIVLGILICLIAFSYFKRYTLKARLIPIGALIIVSFILMLPIFSFTILTLIGLFMFERLWILLALVLIIEVMVNKKNRTLMIIFSVISVIMYFFLRTRI